MRNNQCYILVNGKIKKATVLEWTLWFGDINKRLVDKTQIDENDPKKGYVSTVCIGIDHNISLDLEDWKENPPILFESMVFGGEEDGECWRYASFGEAKRGHWIIVDCVRRGEPVYIPFGQQSDMKAIMEMLKDMIAEQNAGEEWKNTNSEDNNAKEE